MKTMLLSADSSLFLWENTTTLRLDILRLSNNADTTVVKYDDILKTLPTKLEPKLEPMCNDCETSDTSSVPPSPSSPRRPAMYTMLAPRRIPVTQPAVTGQPSAPMPITIDLPITSTRPAPTPPAFPAIRPFIRNQEAQQVTYAPCVNGTIVLDSIVRFEGHQNTVNIDTVFYRHFLYHMSQNRLMYIFYT